jgi:hypothetical protein
MQRYILSYNCGFKIGLYGYRQVDVNISEFNTEVLVSPLLNGNQNGVENQSISIKLKLKTLILIINYIYRNIEYNTILNKFNNKEHLISGLLNNNIINKIKNIIFNNKSIEILVYFNYNIIYNHSNNLYYLKNIFYCDIKINNFIDNHNRYKIYLITNKCKCIIISYKTLCILINIIFNKNDKLNIKDILQNDKYYDLYKVYYENNIELIIDEFSNLKLISFESDYLLDCFIDFR